MKKQLLFAVQIFVGCHSFGQVVLASENFDSYTVNQTVATQSPHFICIGSQPGGSTDALVSDLQSASPTNSMRIKNNIDMLYSFSNQTTGKFSIAFKAFFVSQGYINVQHVTQTNWAFDLYFNSSNQIMFLNENNPANGINIGSYSNYTWIDFEFVIDIDLDSVWVYKNGNLAHNDVFHKSTQSGFSSQLAAINFFGLSQFNGVSISNFYIDDFVATNLSATESVNEFSNTNMTMFPNPCNSGTTVTADVSIQEITVSDLNGRICFKKQLDFPAYSISIDSLNPGSYFVLIQHEKGTVAKNLVVE